MIMYENKKVSNGSQDLTRTDKGSVQRTALECGDPAAAGRGTAFICLKKDPSVYSFLQLPDGAARLQ
jgi:hypothetical protein